MLHLRSLAVLASLTFAPVVVRAQCTNAWQPGFGLAGVSGFPDRAVLRDPDGAGPLPARIVVSGDTHRAGKVMGSVVEWDPATGEWSELPGGLRGHVQDLIVAPNGDLFAVGSSLGTDPSQSYAAMRWHGGSWSPLGNLYGGGRSVAVLPSGEVVIGGVFDVYDANGSWLGVNLAVWNGTELSVPFGLVDGTVGQVLVRNGDVIVRGDFWTTGGVVTRGFARWDGTMWSDLQYGYGYVAPDTMALLSDGNLVALFHPLFGPPDDPGTDVAVWNGSTWTPLPPTGLDLERLFVRANGDVLVSTWGSNHVVRWSGVAWVPLSTGDVVQRRPIGEDAAGHLLLAIGMAEHATGIARWDGTTLSSLGSGIVVDPGQASTFSGFATCPDGSLVACGSFTRLGDVIARRVARWNGTSWSPLGPGLGGQARAIAALPNGDVVVAGELTIGTSPDVEALARWDGTAWSPLPWPMVGTIRALCVLPNGDLVTGGTFHGPADFLRQNSVVRWDGTTWSAIGNGVRGTVHSLAVAPNGDLIVGGAFVEVDSPSFFPGLGVLALRVARWNGSSWSAFGGTTANDNGLDGNVLAVTARPNGDVVVGGTFSFAAGVPAAGVARWDGSAWQAMPGGNGAHSLAVLPDGDVVAATGTGVLRWDGTVWTPLSTTRVDTLHMHHDGLFVGGYLVADDGSIGVARLASTCPAAATTIAPGCQGATLSAATLPWVDGTLRTIGTGLPAPSLVLAVTGFQPAVPSVPLANLLPQGLPGCDLHVLPDGLQTLVADQGTAVSNLFVPSMPAIVGLRFLQQMIAFAVDGNGAITSAVGTNALQLTAGQF